MCEYVALDICDKCHVGYSLMCIFDALDVKIDKWAKNENTYCMPLNFGRLGKLQTGIPCVPCLLNLESAFHCRIPRGRSGYCLQDKNNLQMY